MCGCLQCKLCTHVCVHVRLSWSALLMCTSPNFAYLLQCTGCALHLHDENHPNDTLSSRVFAKHGHHSHTPEPMLSVSQAHAHAPARWAACCAWPPGRPSHPQRAPQCPAACAGPPSPVRQGSWSSCGPWRPSPPGTSCSWSGAGGCSCLSTSRSCCALCGFCSRWAQQGVAHCQAILLQGAAGCLGPLSWRGLCQDTTTTGHSMGAEPAPAAP